jgi:hypothetical protein
MRLRDKYLLLKHNRTFIKGWLHLISSIYLLHYYLNNRNKRYIIFIILSFFISAIYHLITFDNITYDKCISLLDYILVLIIIYRLYYNTSIYCHIVRTIL